MHEFTIRDIEILTGIKSQKLHIWQKRFELFPPKRNGSRIRLYNKEDLKRLVRISFLYHTGWKITDIATLTEEEIVQQINLQKTNNENINALIHYLVATSIALNESIFTEAVESIANIIGFENCIINVCYPCLQKINMLWSKNNITSPQEYYYSYLIRNKIIAETIKIPVESVLPEILLISPEGAYHELQLSFINYLLKKNNWQTMYLGTGIKLNEVLQLASLTEINYLFIHLYDSANILDPDDYLEQICKAFSGKKVVVSGEGLRNMQRNFINLIVLKTDQQIYEFIERNPIL